MKKFEEREHNSVHLPKSHDEKSVVLEVPHFHSTTNNEYVV